MKKKHIIYAHLLFQQTFSNQYSANYTLFIYFTSNYTHILNEKTGTQNIKVMNLI